MTLVELVGPNTRSAVIAGMVCLSLWLTGCDGGGGGDSAPAQPSIAVQLDTGLASSTQSVRIDTVSSAVDTTKFNAQASTDLVVDSTAPSVYAADPSGRVLLFGRASDGRIRFSATETVRTLAALVAATYLPDKDLKTLETWVAQQPGFGDLVSRFASVYGRGENPAYTPEFRAQLDAFMLTLLSESTKLGARAGPAFDQPLKTIQALPSTRVELENRTGILRQMALLQGYAPLFSQAFTVGISNPVSPNAHVLHNATPVFWEADLLDVDGRKQQTLQLDGTALPLSALGIATPVKLPLDPPDASYAVALRPDFARNAAAAALSIVSLTKKAWGSYGPKIEDPTCLAELTKFFTNKSMPVLLEGQPPSEDALWSALKKGTLDALSASPKLLQLCSPDKDLPLLPADLTRLSKVVDWVKTASEASQLATQLHLWLKFSIDPPAPVGVCVSSGGYIQNCLSSMSAPVEPLPVATGIASSFQGEVALYDRRGSALDGQPSQLSCVYEPVPGTPAAAVACEVASFTAPYLTYTVRATGALAQGSVRIRHAATDVSQAVPVKVSLGRFLSGVVEVPIGQSADVPLLEADGNRPLLVFPLDLVVRVDDPTVADVLLTPGPSNGHTALKTLQMQVKGKVFGRQTTVTLTSATTGAEIARAVVKVTGGGSGYWLLRQSNAGCVGTPLPAGGAYWVHQNPCFALGGETGATHAEFYLDDVSPNVGVLSFANGGGLWRIFPLGWRSSDAEFRLAVNVMLSQTEQVARETVFTVTSRTPTALAGVFTMRTTSRYAGPTGVWMPGIPTMATGNWSATYQIGPSPVPPIKLGEICSGQGTRPGISVEYGLFDIPPWSGGGGACSYTK